MIKRLQCEINIPVVHVALSIAKKSSKKTDEKVALKVMKQHIYIGLIEPVYVHEWKRKFLPLSRPRLSATQYLQ